MRQSGSQFNTYKDNTDWKKFPKKQTQKISPFWDVSMVAVIFSLILLAVVFDVSLLFPVKFCYENS